MDADQIKAAWSLVSRIEGVPWPTGGDALDAACALRALLGEVERLRERAREIATSPGTHPPEGCPPWECPDYDCAKCVARYILGEP